MQDLRAQLDFLAELERIKQIHVRNPRKGAGGSESVLRRQGIFRS